MVSPAIRCEVIWDQEETPWAMNVLHLPPTVGVINQGTADDVAAALQSALATSSVLPELSDQVRVRSVRLKDLRQISTDTFETVLFVNGTGSPSQIPDNVSLAYQLRTIEGVTNGRVYQWGWGINANAASGRPTIQGIEAGRLLWENFHLALPISSALSGLGVLSRTSNTLAMIEEVRRSPSANAQGWQTQRRRSDGLPALF